MAVAEQIMVLVSLRMTIVHFIPQDQQSMILVIMLLTRLQIHTP